MTELKLSHSNPFETSDGIIALTPSLTIMSANHVITWLIGNNTPTQGKIFPLKNIFREPDLTIINEAINKTFETCHPVVGLSVNLICFSGGTLKCDCSVLPIFDLKQAIIGVILNFKKNSRTFKNKHPEKKKNVSSPHTPPEFQALFEGLPEGVFTITTHFRISSFNHTIEKITGYSREEVIGKYCWEVLRSDKCKSSCPLKKALENSQSIMDQEVIIVHKNGKREVVLANSNILRDQTGLVVGAVETIRPLFNELQASPIIDVRYPFTEIVGRSKSMQRLFSMIPDVAISDANVLICGESGTGKDLFAQAIHKHSLRSKGPFTAINCSALAESLLESELFGHEKAAFTGAERLKRGRFEIAKGGTLFLDEIGELKPELQIKLLRVFEQREFERVGSTSAIPMEVRIICATNKNLVESIKEGRFREDFYYRLHTVTLTLPPLRERKEDLPLLVSHFITKYNKKYNKKVRSVDLKVMQFFQNYHFPGNVRELEHILEHAFVFVKGPVIFMSSLPPSEDLANTSVEQKKSLQHQIRPKSKESILWALSQTRGKRQQAADLLQISRTSLWRHMKELDIN